MTDADASPEPYGKTLEEEAASWFSRMRGPEAQYHGAEFEAWLARGAVHRAAYNRAGEIFALGKFLHQEPEANAHSKPHERGPLPCPAPSIPKRRAGRWVLGTALACILGAGVWLTLQQGSDEPGAASRIPLVGSSSSGGEAGQLRLTTNTGQSLSQRLPDGSQVTLDANSEVMVGFDPAYRGLRLERGSARFEVAHETRPFTVRVAGGMVTARGTIFDIAIMADSAVRVHLVQGRIDVAEPQLKQVTQAIRHLEPGQSISFQGLPDTASQLGNGSSIAPVRDQAFAAGLMIHRFDNIRVADVIAEANRHNKSEIALASPEIGNQRISGRFRISDAQSLADRLGLMFNLRVDHDGPSTIILRQK
jgi:transmembrane sensor